jgi:(2Fe-2S) ferredoxin
MRSLLELQKLKEEVEEKIKLRHQNERIRVIVEMGTCGISAGARQVMNRLSEEIEEHKLNDVTLTQVDCKGFCDKEPVVEIEYEDGTRRIYGEINVDKVEKLVAEDLINEHVIQEWVINS